MKEKLITLADRLDKLGLTKEADVVDRVLFAADDEENEKEYTYSITYEIVTEESAEQGDAAERGYEVEDAKGTLKEILKEAQKLGIHEPSSYPSAPGDWWSSTYHVEDRRYFEKGERKYYALHIEGSPEEKAEAHAFLSQYLK